MLGLTSQEQDNHVDLSCDSSLKLLQKRFFVWLHVATKYPGSSLFSSDCCNISLRSGIVGACGLKDRAQQHMRC